MICIADLKIAHKCKSDIKDHLRVKKHSYFLKKQNLTIKLDYFLNAVKSAEYLFVKFILEQTLQNLSVF